VPDRSGESFRQALAVPKGAPVIGFVARLAPEKGPSQFVRVAQLVHGKQPDVHFVIVGEGPMETQLAGMIRDMDLGTYVHMAGLWTNVWDVYPAFDVLVQTSRSEGMPLVGLEAMACGRPVVAMDVGGVAELMEMGTTGLLVAPGEHEAMAGALLELLASPARLQEMGRAGRRRVEALLPLQTSMHHIGELLCSLAGRRTALRYRPVHDQCDVQTAGAPIPYGSFDR
jgi:glycosyltransferase involved in cell wall biosynthesis